MAGYKLKSIHCMCCVLFRSGHPAQLPTTGGADTEGLSVVAPHHCPQNHRGQTLRVCPLVSLNSGYCSIRDFFGDFVMSCLKVCSISFIRVQTMNLFGFSLEVICVYYISYVVVHVLVYLKNMVRIYLIDFLPRQFSHSIMCLISKHLFCILSSCYMTASTNFCMM